MTDTLPPQQLRILQLIQMHAASDGGVGVAFGEPRGPHTDRHIAACFAAQACPCRTNATWQWLPSGGAA